MNFEELLSGGEALSSVDVGRFVKELSALDDFNEVLTLLRIAHRNGHAELVGAFFESNVQKVCEADIEGDTALMFAAYEGGQNLIDLLIRLGAAINQTNNIGQSALMLAAKSAQHAVIKSLVGAGAEVNQQDQTGRTALHWALTERDSPMVCDVLISAGANPDLKSQHGLSAVDYARKLRRDESLRVLLREKRSN